MRYSRPTKEKANGATYTPQLLSDFVAARIVESAGFLADAPSVRVLDPAVGNGQLLASLLKELSKYPKIRAEVHGFDTDHAALFVASRKLKEQFPVAQVTLTCEDFLKHVAEKYGTGNQESLFQNHRAQKYDLVIANPPYVRTQIIGSSESRVLAQRFGLSGRVDLYHAFLVAITQILEPHSIAGIIVSNRFMTTRSGAAIRELLSNRCVLRHIWDLGDTKLFGVAVLPSILLIGGENDRSAVAPRFTSIY